MLFQERSLVFFLVVPELSGISVQRAIIIWLSKQTLYGEKDCAAIVRGRPFLFEDV